MRAVGYGLVGCGSFGNFCLEQYSGMREIRLVAAADARPVTAERTAARFGMVACATPGELIARDDVDVVHVATPPVTHAELTLAALAAGKHVLCEKPLAIGIEDARSMVETAGRARRVLAANLIMRYAPACEIVKRLVEGRLLGEPLHGFFENYAKDEDLPPGHWFWDRRQSGGIFVEHGVHFFDLFGWWLGPGRVVAAQETCRPGTDLTEQVGCTALYGQGDGRAVVNMYHGFTQAGRMDRQQTRLVFERGSVTLPGWVPEGMTVDALVDDATLEKLVALMPGARIETIEAYEGDRRRVTSRHKTYVVDRRVAVRYDAGMSKIELYGHVLRSLLADQVAAMDDPAHERRVTEDNGLASLAMALEADGLARLAAQRDTNGADGP